MDVEVESDVDDVLSETCSDSVVPSVNGSDAHFDEAPRAHGLRLALGKMMAIQDRLADSTRQRGSGAALGEGRWGPGGAGESLETLVEDTRATLTDSILEWSLSMPSPRNEGMLPLLEHLQRLNSAPNSTPVEKNARSAAIGRCLNDLLAWVKNNVCDVVAVTPTMDGYGVAIDLAEISTVQPVPPVVTADIRLDEPETPPLSPSPPKQQELAVPTAAEVRPQTVTTPAAVDSTCVMPPASLPSIEQQQPPALAAVDVPSPRQQLVAPAVVAPSLKQSPPLPTAAVPSSKQQLPVPAVTVASARVLPTANVVGMLPSSVVDVRAAQPLPVHQQPQQIQQDMTNRMRTLSNASCSLTQNALGLVPATSPTPVASVPLPKSWPAPVPVPVAVRTECIDISSSSSESSSAPPSLTRRQNANMMPPRSTHPLGRHLPGMAPLHVASVEHQQQPLSSNVTHRHFSLRSSLSLRQPVPESETSWDLASSLVQSSVVFSGARATTCVAPCFSPPRPAMAPLYPQPTAQSSSALTLDQILQMEEEGQRANQERERGRKWALEMQNRQQLRPKQGLAEHQLLDEQQKAQQLVEEQRRRREQEEEQHLAEQQRLVEQRQREQMEKKQRRQQQREQTRAHQQQQYTARQQHYMAQQLFLQQVQALSLANPHLSPQQISMMLLMQQQAQRAQTPQYHQHHASPPPPLQQQQQRAPAQFHWMPATGQQLVTPISGNYEYMAVSQMPSAPSPAAAFNWPPPWPPASASSSMTLSSVATAPPSPAAA
ncbi:hypothetical protein GGI21_003733, partial [Coemansia aciculifera]